MLETFNEYIKPLNDQLSKDLGVITVNVQHKTRTQTIPVYITYTSHSGNVVTRKAGQTSFYRSLGLMI